MNGQAFQKLETCEVLRGGLVGTEWIRTDREDGASLFTLPKEYGTVVLLVLVLSESTAYVQLDATFQQNYRMKKLQTCACLSIACCLEGDAWLLLANGKEPIGPGNLLYSGTAFGTQVNNAEILHKAGVHYARAGFFTMLSKHTGFLEARGREALLSVLCQARQDGVQIPHVTRNARISRLFEPAYREQMHRPEAKLIFLQSAALGICALLLEQGIDGMGGEHAIIDPGEYALLRRVRERMLSDYAHPMTLQQISREVGLNETRLKKNFKLVYGAPIYQYFKKAKLKHAMELLVATKLSVREVAFQCGYSSQGQFCAAFRKQYGISPLQARKRYFVNH